MVTITQDSHPALWSMLSLIGASMHQLPHKGISVSYSGDLALAEASARMLPFDHTLVLCGVITCQSAADDELFDRLVGTAAGRFLSAVASMP